MSIKTKDNQQDTLSIKSVWKISLALFCMFFGAGNLIFPLIIGQNCGQNVGFAISGLSLTAVFVPLLGLISMVLFQGDTKSFFGRMGKKTGFLVFLLLQLIVGPFGVIPRLIVLMHAMASPYLGHVSLTTFSTVTCLIIFISALKPTKLVSLLGTYLTPVLIGCLVAIITLGFYKQGMMNPLPHSSLKSFYEGFVGGYNTMDLIAAFLFATVILPYFRTQSSQDSEVLPYKKIILSCMGACLMLLVTYMGLSFVSAKHGPLLSLGVPKEQMLSALSSHLLGPWGALLAACCTVLACLTTAMTLAAIFASYIHDDISFKKISKTKALIATLIISCIFATLGFNGIGKFLGPILQLIYPSLIALSVMNICHKIWGVKYIKLPVVITFIISSYFYFF